MTSISSLSIECSAIAQQIRSELSSIQISSDTTGFTTVMGAGCKSAGISNPSELSATIKADPALNKAFSTNGLDSQQKAEVARAIRGLMDTYASKVADATYAKTFEELEATMARPNLTRAHAGAKLLDILDSKMGELKDAAARVQQAGNKSAATTAAAAKYEESIKFVKVTAAKLSSYDLNIAQLTNQIDEIMFSGDSAPTTTAKDKQTIRKSMISEREFVQQRLVHYFDASAQSSKDSKVYLKELKIPDQLEKDKGVELIMATKGYLKNRTLSFYAIMPDLTRIMSESKIGNFYKPASKKDGFASVPIEIRSDYTLQAQELYDELCLKVPNKVMQNIRVSFKYGLEEK